MCIRDRYYGLNALSGNMILLDRKQSRCPNGLVFGTPGSGKSMSCKREIAYVMLTTKDNVIICDPEDEYSPLVNRLGGQVIRLSPNSRDYVNPLDINLNYSEEENPLALKSDFVLSFCELIMGSKTGLEAIEKTVIDLSLIHISLQGLERGIAAPGRNRGREVFAGSNLRLERAAAGRNR